MFRPRRPLSARHRCSTPDRGQGEGAPPNPEGLHHALRLFKKLKDEQLWQLAEAVESKGRWDCGCVYLPLEARAGPASHVLLCKLYRWPDLRNPSELKRLNHCQSYWRTDGEAASICCNPYHLSRVTTAVPAVAFSYKARVGPALSKPLHSISNQESSYHRVWDTTLSRGSHNDGHWCKLAYWEHRTRVGRLYSVTEPSIQIFHDLPKGSGFCLGFLGSHSRNEAVKRTRKKIGQGLVLSHEQDEVWVYNRSEHPMFINSPTLALVTTRGQSVHKLLPGYSIKVFDSRQAERFLGCSSPGEGPCDLHSVRISFAKGWGGCYSRQFITSCPCWLEILLSTPK